MTEGTQDVETIPRMFRQHQQPPTGVQSPLFRELTREWAALHHLPSTTTTVRRWARREPRLAPYNTPGQIVDAIDETDPAGKDELLLSLIRLFQSGQQLAGRTVLQAMLPKLARTANYATAETTSTREDARHITLAEFWDILANYPTSRRPTSIAANLALDTLHRICPNRRTATEIPVEPEDIHILRSTGLWKDPGETENPETTAIGGVTSDSDLTQVINWALGQSVIASDEAHLLAECYLAGPSFGFPAAAARRGITITAARQRCSRASRRIAEAIARELDPSKPAKPVLEQRHKETSERGLRRASRIASAVNPACRA